jgi:hypothetical protein
MFEDALRIVSYGGFWKLQTKKYLNLQYFGLPYVFKSLTVNSFGAVCSR